MGGEALGQRLAVAADGDLGRRGRRALVLDAIDDGLRLANDAEARRGDEHDAAIALVIGILASKGSAFGQSQDTIALIPVTRFLSDYGANNRSLSIATQAPDQQLYNDTVDRAISAMRVVRGLKAEDDNDFDVSSNDSLIAAFATVADALQRPAVTLADALTV